MCCHPQISHLKHSSGTWGWRYIYHECPPTPPLLLELQNIMQETTACFTPDCFDLKFYTVKKQQKHFKKFLFYAISMATSLYLSSGMTKSWRSISVSAISIWFHYICSNKFGYMGIQQKEEYECQNRVNVLKIGELEKKVIYFSSLILYWKSISSIEKKC